MRPRYRRRPVNSWRTRCSAQRGEHPRLPSGHMHGTRDELVALPPPFEIVLRGFDRQQVIDHVNALKTRVATLNAERDAAVERVTQLTNELELLRREEGEAIRQVERLRREAQHAADELDRLHRSPLAGATTRIKHMLQMAEDEAAEVRAAAEEETASLRENTRAEADQLLSETQRRCERLEAASLDQRQRAEEQSERDIASRQAETEAWIKDYQTCGISALYLLMQLAGERLNSRVAKVKRQVAAAKALRMEVTEQLSTVQRLLVEVLGGVEASTPAELAQRAEVTESAEVTRAAAVTEPPEPAEDARPSDARSSGARSSGARSSDAQPSDAQPSDAQPS